jgi:hypothetical protein
MVNCAPPLPAQANSQEKYESSTFKVLGVIRKILEILVWPVVALLVVYKLSPEIKQKLPFLKSVQAGPWKAEFSQQVAEVRKEAENQFPQFVAEPLISADEARLLQIAKTSPRAAIMEAWREVEITATKTVKNRQSDREVASDASTSVRRPKSLVSLARELSSLEILNAQQLSVFHELRNLRNEAAHAEQFEMHFESANNYIQTALSLIAAIQAA